MSYKTHMHGSGESSSGIVPMKRWNAGQGGPKENVERRLLAKQNAKPPIPAPNSVPNIGGRVGAEGQERSTHGQSDFHVNAIYRTHRLTSIRWIWTSAPEKSIAENPWG
jgi:hypothetical protein